MPGASDLLRDLHAAGYRLGVASAGPRANADCLLRRLSGAEFVSATVSADETRFTKPHPEPFLACARALGVAPGACVVVEDSVHGLKGAKAAGMGAVGLVGTSPAAALRAHADLVVNSLTEIGAERIASLVAR